MIFSILLILFVLKLPQPARASPTYLLAPMDPLPQTFIDYGHDLLPSYQHQRREQQQSTFDQYPPDATFARLRIRFITDAINTRRGESAAIDAEIDEIINTVLAEVASLWSYHLAVMPMVGGRNFTANDTCVAQVLADKINSTYVDDADLVIFVTGEDELPISGTDFLSNVCVNTTTLAAATPCLIDQWDRPVTGLMNFCLGKQNQGKFPNLVQTEISNYTNVQLRYSHIQPSLVKITQHEMAHVLGFNSILYKNFRQPDGTPRTPRPVPYVEYTCVTTGLGVRDEFPSNETIRFMPKAGLLEEGYYMVTPRVRQVTRNHFDCQELVGARLETAGDCIGSHWHERQYYGESMGPQYSRSSENQLSELTLALMEDSGWYRLNYQNVQYTVFGLGQGCAFYNDPCIVNDTVPQYGAGAFCSTPIRSGIDFPVNLRSIRCDPGYRQWTLCDLFNDADYAMPVFETNATIHYFSDPNLVASFPFADYCPVPDFPLGLDCTRNDPYNPFYVGELVGLASRCLPVSFQGTDASTSETLTIHRPACLNMTCDRTNRVVRLGQGSDELICQYEGQTVTIRTMDGRTATLVCPKLADLCPDLFGCPASCSGRGICMYDAVSPFVASCQCFSNETTTTTGNGCYPTSVTTGTTEPTGTPGSSEPGMTIMQPTSTTGTQQPGVTISPSMMASVGAPSPTTATIPGTAGHTGGTPAPTRHGNFMPSPPTFAAGSGGVGGVGLTPATSSAHPSILHRVPAAIAISTPTTILLSLSVAIFTWLL